MSIWRKIGQFFTRLFKKTKEVAEKFIPKAIELVNNIKNFDTTNPATVDIITALIPGHWDDTIKDKARLIIAPVLKELSIVKPIEGETDADYVKRVIDELQKLLPKAKAVQLHGLAILFVDAMSDGELSVNEATALVKGFYEVLHQPQP